MALQPLRYDIKAKDKTAGAFRSVETRTKRATMAIGRLKVAATAASAVLVAGLAFGFRKASAAMEEFDLISKRARQFGLDSDFYQALAFQAGEMSIQQNRLNNALGTFIRRVGLAASNQGAMTESLKKSNPELLKAILAAKTQTERLKLVADAIKNAKTKTDALAISYATMGDRTGELARLMRGGADAFEASAVKAAELGIIIDRDLLVKAEQLQNDYGNVARVLDLELKQAFIDLGPVMIEAMRIATAVARSISQVFSNMRAVENRSRRALLARRETLTGLLEGPLNIEGGFSEGLNLAELEKINSQLLKIAAARRALEFMPDTSLLGAEELVPVEIIEKTTAAVKSLTTATDEQAKAQDDVNQASEFFANTAIDAFIGMALNGEKATDILQNMIPILARLILQAALLGQGPLAGLFGGGLIGGVLGSIFGGGRAHGGPVSSGKAYMVGERGPEMFMPRSSGSIIPNGGGSPGRVVIVMEEGGMFAPRVKEISGSVSVEISGAMIGQNERRRQRAKMTGAA